MENIFPLLLPVATNLGCCVAQFSGVISKSMDPFIHQFSYKGLKDCSCMQLTKCGALCGLCTIPVTTNVPCSTVQPPYLMWNLHLSPVFICWKVLVMLRAAYRLRVITLATGPSARGTEIIFLTVLANCWAGTCQGFFNSCNFTLRPCSLCLEILLKINLKPSQSHPIGGLSYILFYTDNKTSFGQFLFDTCILFTGSLPLLMAMILSSRYTIAFKPHPLSSGLIS